jgi:hypothetical protein
MSSDTRYVIPAADEQGAPIVIEIGDIVKAEARLQEVANVNSHNAAELLSTFNERWLQLHQNVNRLTFEKNKAEEAAKFAYSQAILDCNDETVKARGHNKTSADLREAIANVNPSVRSARERLNQIKAVLDYMSSKARAFENGYNSVKKLVSTGQPMPGDLSAPGRQFSSPPTSKYTPEVDPFQEEDLPGFVDPIYKNRR